MSQSNNVSLREKKIKFEKGKEYYFKYSKEIVSRRYKGTNTPSEYDNVQFFGFYEFIGMKGSKFHFYDNHNGIDIIISKEEALLYLKEHPTEAEVSKEEETVEQYAKNYLKKLDDESGPIWTEDNEDIVKAFIHIANWQKEKDRVLIEALLQSYKKLYDSIDSCVDLTPELLQSSKKAITKAEQHLKIK